MAFNFRHISPVNLILTPVKQHLGCCVIAPLVVKFLGGAALATTFVTNKNVEFAFLAVLLPIVVYLILKGEDYWRTRHERKHSAHGEHCNTHCHAEPNDFWKRYALNLVVAFVIAFLMHVLFHQHVMAPPAMTPTTNLASNQ